MKIKPLSICSLLALGSLATANAYADANSNMLYGNVQFMTNYVGRGLAQSVGQPSVEGEIDYNSNDGLYGGIDGNSINWVNELYPGDSVSLEVDAWAGYRKSIDKDWTLKFSILRLQFPGKYVPQNPPVDQPNSTEAVGYIAWKGLSAQLNYAITDYFGTPDSKGSTYLTLSASQPIANSWILGAHLGRKTETGTDPATHISNARDNYTDYKFSLTYDMGEGLNITIAHTWTNANPQLYTLNGYAVGGHHTWFLVEKDF